MVELTQNGMMPRNLTKKEGGDGARYEHTQNRQTSHVLPANLASLVSFFGKFRS